MGTRQPSAGSPPLLVAISLSLGVGAVGMATFGPVTGAALVLVATVASGVGGEISRHRAQRDQQRDIAAFYAQYDVAALRETLRLIRALPSEQRSNYLIDVRVIRMLLAHRGGSEA